MKDEADKFTIDAWEKAQEFGGDHNPALHAEAAAKGMTPDTVRQGYASGTALKRLSDPEDVANLALYLASDGARMISGQALAVDGMTYNVDP